MYKVKISINGIIKEITIEANDAMMVQGIITNMYGNTNGQVQIIDIRRI